MSYKAIESDSGVRNAVLVRREEKILYAIIDSYQSLNESKALNF